MTTTIVPPHDLDAEAAVLSATMLDPSAIDRVAGLRPEHFYSEAHRRIFEAALAVHAMGSPVDTTTVSDRLRATRRMSQVGGMPYIASILDATPAPANVGAHAAIIRDHAARRQLSERLARLSARCLDPGSDVERIATEAASAIEPTSRGASPILTTEDLYAPSTSASWLVRDLGIAPGAPSFFVGQGFVGKTLSLMSLGVSVATGREIWGRFLPSRRGRVLHIDAEQGRRVTSRRFQRLVAGIGASRAELADRWGCIVLPAWNLTSSDAYDRFSRASDGYDLVILDSLKNLTPGVEENSSAIRDYLGVLTRVSEATGAVFFAIHHAGKSDPKGQRARKEMGRGSSAIFDEAQSYFVATGEKGAPFLVSHEKDRERGETCEDFSLGIEDVTIGDDPKGGLRVVHVEPPSEGDLESERERAACSAVSDYVARHPNGPFGKRDIRAAVKLRTEVVDWAIGTMIEDGRLRNIGSASRPHYQVIGLA